MKIAVTKKHMGDCNPNIITILRVLAFTCFQTLKTIKLLDFVSIGEYQLASGNDTKMEELMTSTESSMSTDFQNTGT